MKEHNENTLPKWVQKKLNELRTTVRELETYRTMHAVLEDKERDWFTLPNPIGGCAQEELSLWILATNRPFPVCTLYKEDMLFIGRAHKRRYGERLVDVDNSNIPLEKIKEVVRKNPPERIKRVIPCPNPEVEVEV